MQMPSFVVSTEEKNTQNIILKTRGGDAKYFNRNPVMLFMHDEYKIIGRWENLRIENNCWVADPVFDLDDEFAKGIAGKVERGFIKAASVSVWPIECHLEVDGSDETLVADTWEFREISIAVIPSNRSALVKLCDENGKEINFEKGFKLSDQLSGVIKKNAKNNMDLKQIAKVLNLSDNASEEEINAALRKAAKAEADLMELKKEQDQARKTEAINLADEAVADGRIKAEQKERFLKLADTDFLLFKETLAGIQKPLSLNDALRTAQQGNTPKGRDAWTFSDWSEKDPEGLYNLAKSNFTKYSQIFKEAYGHEPQPVS